MQHHIKHKQILAFAVAVLANVVTASIGHPTSISLVSPVKAADIAFGNVLPGGGVIQKNLISMREMKFVNMVQQHTDFSCGAAALATILNYVYNQNLTEEQVIEGMLKVSDVELVRQKGFSLLDIKNYTQSIGMRGRGYNVQAATLEKITIPTIVLLNYKGYKHFVVLKKATADKVYIADPALGNRIMKRVEFDASWNGIVFAVIGQGFNRESVLLQPKEGLTARTLINNYRPLTDAELFDYGFVRSDLLGL
ncbi:MAG: C39 family peptidase [Methylotenera sp.]|nr:C39 family peptidase [Methylotenera sp.]MDP1755104.1 C39 family peptidase [Methylotenera sp.]MDP1958314.1 C39 family peptidase [Methylotenera sp.]MDP3206961.1 C39 family peptidase [Methylotenera sp.]MDP3302739.1 C39 family peptidase [Methylotenera sp.]